MTTLNERLQIFSQALSEQPEKFNLQDLEDLAKILAELTQSSEDEARKKLNSWFRNHEVVTDTIDNLTPTKEINTSPRPPVSREAGIIQNILELEVKTQQIIQNEKEQGDEGTFKVNEGA